MTRFFFICIICLCTHKAWAELTVGLRADVLLSSPAMELDKLESSWQSPSHGNYAQGRAVLETYVEISDRFELGVEERMHYILGFSEATAQFYSRLENNDIDNGVYDLSLSINAAQARGVFAQYFIPLSSSNWIKLKAHVLKGLRVQDGDLSGQGSVTDAGFNYDWQLDYAYDENRILDGQQRDVTGWGYSFDIYAFTQLNDQHSLLLSLEDLFYTLHWQNIDQDNGCLDRPLTVNCSVFTERSSYDQRFPVFAKLEWGYTIDDLKTSVEAQAWQRYRALLLGVDYHGAQFEVDAVNEMLNIGYESARLKVKWGFDQIDFAQAKHWQLTLDMNWPIL